MLKNVVIASFLSLFAISACASNDVGDPFAGEETEELADGKADAVDGTYTYFLAERDTRKCVSPLCGGWWVSRVNRSDTKCADGRFAERCYVAEVDLSAIGIDAIGENALLRGQIKKKDFGGGFGKLGNFVASEAWAAGSAAGVIDGVFVKGALSGVRCITYPCPAYLERKLNSSARRHIAEIDFSASGATEKELEAAYAQLLSGVLFVGDHYVSTGPGGKMGARTANQFWVKMEKPAAKTCFVGGCSGQVCSDQEGVITTCEFRPEYACYQDAECAVQADGECGWTATEPLDACLADPPSDP